MKQASFTLMGIVNRTPDSFFAASRLLPGQTDVQPALDMVKKGADILDIGGESSRPGSEYVSAEDEIQRVIPFIRELRKNTSITVSVDTRKAIVAEAALEAGADWINDISALRDDPDLALVVADHAVPVVLMHMAGTPRNMQKNPIYEDVVTEVEAFLVNAADRAVRAGIKPENIILDPGIGFGKTLQHNIALIQAIPRFKKLGFRILMGLSRKTMLGMLAGSPEAPLPPEERFAASISAQLICLQLGADIIRVHDVAAMRQAMDTALALWPSWNGVNA